MKLMNCNNCDIRLGAPNDDHFFYCSAECKAEKEEKDRTAREEEVRTHSPWSRWDSDTREEMRQLQNVTGPFRWTEESLAAAERELGPEGGGPPKLRADGEIDGRAAGNRKCGKCGEGGHNARTCSGIANKAAQTAALAARIAAEPKDTVLGPLVSSSTVAGPLTMGEAARVPNFPGRPQDATRMPQEGSESVPEPRRHSESSTPRSVAGSEPKLKTCGKCGAKGHNARTCGKVKTDQIGSSSAVAAHRARSGYACGKCGEHGHNARTCNH